MGVKAPYPCPPKGPYDFGVDKGLIVCYRNFVGLYQGCVALNMRGSQGLYAALYKEGRWRFRV